MISWREKKCIKREWERFNKNFLRVGSRGDQANRP